MAYSADSFTFGEVPSTAKWNKLWTNDAAFNDGTGFATSAITPASVATDNFVLAYVQGLTTGQSTTSTSYVDATGITVTFTTPASCTKILLRAEAPVSNTAATVTSLAITNSANTVQVERPTSTASGNAGLVRTVPLSCRVTVAASTSLTYKLRFKVDAGTGVINQGDIADRFTCLWVERA